MSSSTEARPAKRARADTTSIERPAEGHLQVSNLSRVFGEGGVRDATFAAEKGELITLLGPSGCGKTTTLRCLAGIEVPDEGFVRLGSTVMTSSEKRLHLKPSKRDIGMVFQSYALWPHMTVFENVAFPLRTRGEKTPEIRVKVEEMLEMVGLDGKSGRTPGQLSGGQQQRVALARALVYRPSLLLLDEPLSNLDAARRDAVRRDIGRIQRELGITAVYVTHDQDEAMTLSDRIVVMRDGTIVQNGTPAELLRAPNSLFVAGLLGQINTLTGTLASLDGQGTDGDTTAGVDVSLPGGVVRLFGRLPGQASIGDTVSVVWRPGDITLTEAKGAGSPAPSSANALSGTVLDVRVGSSITDYTVDVGTANPVRVIGLGPVLASTGARVELTCPPARSIVLAG